MRYLILPVLLLFQTASAFAVTELLDCGRTKKLTLGSAFTETTSDPDNDEIGKARAWMACYKSIQATAQAQGLTLFSCSPCDVPEGCQKAVVGKIPFSITCVTNADGGTTCTCSISDTAKFNAVCTECVASGCRK